MKYMSLFIRKDFMATPSRIVEPIEIYSENAKMMAVQALWQKKSIVGQNLVKLSLSSFKLTWRATYKGWESLKLLMAIRAEAKVLVILKY